VLDSDSHFCTFMSTLVEAISIKETVISLLRGFLARSLNTAVDQLIHLGHAVAYVVHFSSLLLRCLQTAVLCLLLSSYRMLFQS